MINHRYRYKVQEMLWVKLFLYFKNPDHCSPGYPFAYDSVMDF